MHAFKRYPTHKQLAYIRRDRIIIPQRKPNLIPSLGKGLRMQSASSTKDLLCQRILIPCGQLLLADKVLIAQRTRHHRGRATRRVCLVVRVSHLQPAHSLQVSATDTWASRFTHLARTRRWELVRNPRRVEAHSVLLLLLRGRSGSGHDGCDRKERDEEHLDEERNYDECDLHTSWWSSSVGGVTKTNILPRSPPGRVLNSPILFSSEGEKLQTKRPENEARGLLSKTWPTVRRTKKQKQDLRLSANSSLLHIEEKHHVSD